jgi:hypothetical protein
VCLTASVVISTVINNYAAPVARCKHNCEVNSATAAVIILLSIGAALICAAFYGLFARPSGHKGQKRQQEVVNGFRLAGGILLGTALLGCLVVGAGEAFGTMHGTRFSGLGKPGAFVVALVSLALITAIVQRWAKYFAGFIVWGVFNSLIMASSGHLLNNPAIPVTRPLALTMGALCLVTVLASVRFTKSYKLSVVDKLALITWILAFTWAANSERFVILAMSIGSSALVLAWCLHRFKIYRRSHGAAHTNKPQAAHRL